MIPLKNAYMKLELPSPLPLFSSLPCNALPSSSLNHVVCIVQFQVMSIIIRNCCGFPPSQLQEHCSSLSFANSNTQYRLNIHISGNLRNFAFFHLDQGFFLLKQQRGTLKQSSFSMHGDTTTYSSVVMALQKDYTLGLVDHIHFMLTWLLYTG